MDPKKLAAESAYRRVSQPTTISGWHCNYCKKTFKREAAFMRHLCLVKMKIDKLRSSLGLAAYAFYSDWMRANRRTVPSIETFAESRLFNAFYRFAEHNVKVNLAYPDVFIRVMIERDLSPTMWVRDACYTYYLNEIDNELDPIIQVNNSIEFLIKISEIGEVPLEQVFSLLEANQLAELIRNRELSPWLLFCSNAFKKRLTEYDEITRKELLMVVSVTYWSTKFEENAELVNEFKQIAIEYGL